MHNALPWQHHNPVRIVFGAGVLNQLPQHVTGSDVLLVTSPGFTRRGQTANIQRQLKHAHVTVYDQVTPNPDIDDLDSAAKQLNDCAYSTIIALGGGSAIDSAKALRAAFTEKRSAPLASILRNNPTHQWAHGPPLIAIPTTAGTGSEVTPFATVWDRAQRKKHSLEGISVYPDIALLDPENTRSLPETETLHSGLDVISHAMESLWNRHRTPISALWATEALRRASIALPAILKCPADIAQRAQMQEAALLAGLAISQTRTAIAHAISYPLTLHFGIPHGMACAFTLPAIYRQVIAHGLHLPADKQVLENAVRLIEELGIRRRVEKEVGRDALLSVRSEMDTKGRSDNYLIPVKDAITDLFLALNEPNP